MPQPRKYADAAARTRAYRERKQAEAQVVASPRPSYRTWRTRLKEALRLIDEVQDEIGDYMQERSERWQQSERAGELEADKDELYGIGETLGQLNLWQTVRD